MRQLRRYRCEDCNVDTERRRDPGQPLVCFDCGQLRAADNIRAQAEFSRQRREQLAKMRAARVVHAA